MKHIKYFLSLSIFLALLPPSVSAESKLLDQYLQGLTTLKANFTQRLIDEDDDLIEESTGTFKLSRPDRFRWHYKAPYEQEIVSNGEQVWIYDPELLQASVRKLDDAVSDSPALLLSSDASVRDRFNIQEHSEQLGVSWISVQPKSADSSFQTVHIGLKDGELYQMKMHDNFGQTTQITFSNVVKNKPIKLKTFFLNLPDNVDVIRDQ